MTRARAAWAEWNLYEPVLHDIQQQPLHLRWHVRFAVGAETRRQRCHVSVHTIWPLFLGFYPPVIIVMRSAARGCTAGVAARIVAKSKRSGTGSGATGSTTTMVSTASTPQSPRAHYANAWDRGAG